MYSILFVLLPIALIDSTSIVPLSLVPLAILMSSKRPIAATSGFLLGLTLSYLAIGLLIYFGLQQSFDVIAARLEKTLVDPDIIDIRIQIGIGAVLAFIGWKFSAPAKPKRVSEPTTEASPMGAFLFAVGINIVGIPGAIPYFAAINEMMRADLPAFEAVVALVFYQAIFIAPLIGIVILRAWIGARAEPILGWISNFMERVGGRVVMILIFLLGVVLMIDGIGWHLGHPLIPPDLFQ